MTMSPNVSRLQHWPTNRFSRPPLNSEWVPILDRIPPEKLKRSGGDGGSERFEAALGIDVPGLCGNCLFDVKVRKLTIIVNFKPDVRFGFRGAWVNIPFMTPDRVSKGQVPRVRLSETGWCARSNPLEPTSSPTLHSASGP